MLHDLAAVSVGVVGDEVYLDLDYHLECSRKFQQSWGAGRMVLNIGRQARAGAQGHARQHSEPSRLLRERRERAVLGGDEYYVRRRGACRG